MKKMAIVFPGQGAQHTGMGMDLWERSTTGRQILERANQVLDFDLIDLCGNSQAPIDQTAYTQPALLAVSVALYEEFREQTGIKADYFAGLSLGEYSALVAAGGLDYEAAIKLVRKRGIYMEQAGKQTAGAMAAVLRAKSDIVAKYCQQESGRVSIANYNCPGQVVISGEKEAVKRVSERFLAEGIKVIGLKVSGAFHSPLMATAAINLAQELEKIEVKELQQPYITNVTGEKYSGQDIKNLLVEQLTTGVQWERSVRTLIAAGVDTFIEMGPGKTLAGLIRKIDREVAVYTVNSLADIDLVRAEWEERVQAIA